VAKTVLGETIRTAREAKGLSLRKLGNISSIDYSTISRLEKGQFASLDPTKLSRLADHLDLKVDELYRQAGFPDSLSAAAALWSQPSSQAAQAVLTEIDQTINKNKNTQLSKRMMLAEELLATHLATLKLDFARLLAGERLSSVDIHRREMLISVFYDIADTYFGTDSHLPGEFLSAYPSVLEHLKPTNLVDAQNAGDHQSYATRILLITEDNLARDYLANPAIWETYMRKHSENHIRLLQVDPVAAQQTLEACAPGIGWTTEMAVWMRSCALLFEKPDLKDGRDLQLLCPGEPAWRDYIQYVKGLIKIAKTVNLESNRLSFKVLSSKQRDNISLSLDVAYKESV
jgi:transcriptional regulator with XRE-family HTH domain